VPVSLAANPITLEEIEYTIKKLHVGKSPKYDLIINKILKNLTKKLTFFLHIYIQRNTKTIIFFLVMEISNNYFNSHDWQAKIPIYLV